jgi:(2Fe-2S) ferredoxin
MSEEKQQYGTHPKQLTVAEKRANLIAELKDHWYKKTGSVTATEIVEQSFSQGEWFADRFSKKKQLIELIKEIRQRILYDVTDGEPNSSLADLLAMWQKTNNVIALSELTHKRIDNTIVEPSTANQLIITHLEDILTSKEIIAPDAYKQGIKHSIDIIKLYS